MTMVDRSFTQQQQQQQQAFTDLSSTESDVLKSVLSELNVLVKYCDDWVNHYHATQPVNSETLLSTLATALTRCRNDVRVHAKEYKVGIIVLLLHPPHPIDGVSPSASLIPSLFFSQISLKRARLDTFSYIKVDDCFDFNDHYPYGFNSVLHHNDDDNHSTLI